MKQKNSTTANDVPGESGHHIRPLQGDSPASSAPRKGSQIVVSYYLRYLEGFTLSQSSWEGAVVHWPYGVPKRATSDSLHPTLTPVLGGEELS